jgi:hypothetical protein
MQNQQQNNHQQQNNSVILDNNNHLKPIRIYIKESFSSNRKGYLVYIDWTFQEMASALSPQITADFNVERNTFQLIPFGQTESEYGYDISHFDGVQLREHWANVAEMGFYLDR